MADKNIRELPEAEELYDDSLPAVAQQGTAMKLTGKKFRSFAEGALEKFIQGAGFLLDLGQTHTGEPGSAAKVENTGTAEKPVLEFTLPRGDKGEKGEVSRAELDDALQRKPGRNILDNWYFLDPINQRGQTEYTGAVYGIDRWRSNDSGNVYCLEKDGLFVGKGLRQYRENMGSLDKMQGTMSVLTAENELLTCSGYFNAANDDWDMAFNAAAAGCWIGTRLKIDRALDFCLSTQVGKKIVAVKLELGGTQTLAHKEGDTWVLNDPPPNRAVELAKCQRYQLVLNSGGRSYAAVGYGVGYTGTMALMYIPVPVEMRADPAISVSGKWCLTKNASTSDDISVSNISGGGSNSSNTHIAVMVSTSNAAAGTFYCLRASGDGTARIILDANV